MMLERLHLASGDDYADFTMKVSVMRTTLAKIQCGPSNTLCTLLVFDGSIYRAADVMEEALQFAAGLVHQDCSCTYCFVWPTLSKQH